MYANIKPNILLKRRAKKLAREAEEREQKRARKDPSIESSAQVFHTVTTHNSVKTTTVVLDSAEQPAPPAHLSEQLQFFLDSQSRFHEALFAHKFHPLIGTPCLCRRGKRSVCCGDCYGHNATCPECFISQHAAIPTHWAKVWIEESGFFVRRDISLLRQGGFAIPFGHGGQPCPRPSNEHGATSTENNHITFHLIDSNGIHNTKVQFCGCHGAPDRIGQLLDFGFFPATAKRPTMAFSFNMLHQFHIHHLESKLPAYDYIGALRRLTDNVFPREVSDPYQQFLIVKRFWTMLAATERLGQCHGIDELTPHRPAGNLVVFCPSCPEPGFNMEERWEDTPDHLKHLNHTLLTLDGNFHANHYKKNSTPDDYSLFAGRAYFPKDADFRAYLRSLPAKDINDKIDCPIKAVKSQYKCADNLAETGIINVQCPDVIVRSTVDLQRGERFANSDFAVKHAIEQTMDLRTGKPFINSAGYMGSYDMSCSYSINMHTRFLERFPDVVPAIPKFTFLIPLVHVNNHKENCVYQYACSYMENAGHFHGETAEHVWAELNQVAPQTRQMNNGHRQDVLIDHHSDWNWKKVVNMAATLANEVVRDRELFSQKREQFIGLSATFAERVPIWNLEDRNLRTISRDKQVQCVFRHRKSKVPTQAKLFAALVEAAAPKEPEDRFQSRPTLAVTVINEALYIEHDQREAALAVSQCETNPAKNADIKKLRKKLRTRIDAWRKLQRELYGDGFSSLESSHSPSEVSLDEPEQEHLYLPSNLIHDQLERCHLGPLATIEVSLRQGRMFDAIRNIQLGRKTCDALNRDKNKNARSQAQKTRASTRYEKPEKLIAAEMANYNACQKALITLGGTAYAESFPIMTVGDTYRKSTHLRREIGDSRLNNGRIYNTGVIAGTQTRPIASLQYEGLEMASGSAAVVATQGSKAKPRNDKKVAKDRKGTNRKLSTTETGVDHTEPHEGGWIWRLQMKDLSSQEVQEWSDESDRVQYFRAEAEMLRWQEEHERKQAQFMRCIRSFAKMSNIWEKLGELNAERPGWIAHAKKTAANYAKLEHDAKQRFRACGYSHRVDAMESSNPPLLADLVLRDREALKDDTVAMEALLCFPEVTNEGNNEHQRTNSC